MASGAKGYQEFRQGWPVVLSAMLGIGVGLTAVPIYTIGSFAPELAREFSWSYASIMGGITITTIGAIFASPLVGLIADRYGVRIVALTSLLLFGASFLLFALSNGSIALFYVTWAMVAILGSGTLPITWTRAVNNWFDVRKGLALGLSLLGTGLFGYFATPFSSWAIHAFGWRGGYVALGLLPVLIAFPVAFFGFRDVGPAGETVASRQAALAARKAVTPGVSFKTAVTHWRFWVIAAGGLMVAFVIGGAIPNMPNILRTNGFERSAVIQLASLIGISVIVGRIVGGWFLDRFWAPAVALFLLGVPSIAFWTLGHGPQSYAVTAGSIFMVGFAAGVEYDLLSFMVARYFGMKSYTLVYGALYAFFAFGAGVGPVVFAHYFDLTQSYATPLSMSAGLLIVSALILLTLGRYRQFDEVPPRAEPLDRDVVAGLASSN